MRQVVRLSLAYAMAASILVGCASPPSAVVPAAPVSSPEDPYAWFDKPLGGFRLALEPYEVVLHASAIEGIALVELRISGDPVKSFADPVPGETLGTLRHVWTPRQPGRYILQARTQDLRGTWSANASVSVEVIERATPTTVPTITPTPELTGTLMEPTFFPEVISFARACGEQAVTATIAATDPALVKVMVAFYRVVDLASGDSTGWESVAMNPLGDGRYRIAIQPSQPGSAMRSAVGPWVERQGEAFTGKVQMQFVLQPVSGDVVRSRVYDAAMLKYCAP